jgi:alkyl hydroperoxide reductase subunit AhpC
MLSDPDLRVIRPYKMEHEMGGVTVGDMGYVIIDREGRIRKHAADPLFGRSADAILQSLRGLQ